jgi:hypothetical protein
MVAADDWGRNNLIALPGLPQAFTTAASMMNVTTGASACHLQCCGAVMIC